MTAILDLATLPASVHAALAQQARAAHQSLQERATAALIEAVGQSRPADSVGLTPKQAELLTFIKGRLQASGVSPSFEEMADALGLKSKSGVHRLLGALEERGRIRRLHNRVRAIEVIGGVR